MTTGLHYAFTDETNTIGRLTLHRIRATRDIPAAGVKAGEVGGWLESLELPNGSPRLSGDAWVYADAWVSGNAWVYGDAWVSGNAQVSGDADWFTVGPIGSESVTATFTRASGGGHILTVGCWTGTLDTLMPEVTRRQEKWEAGDTTQAAWVKQYEALKALGEATITQWGAGS